MPAFLPVLSLLTFLPLAAMLLVLLLPAAWRGAARWLALAACLLQLLVLALYVLPACCPAVPGGPLDGVAGGQLTLSERWDWIDLSLGSLGRLHIEYFLGLDGLSVLMVVLTPIILAVATLASWGQTQGVKGYFALLLLLNTALVGCFLALDFFLFYIFYEFMLLPMFFLVGIWGGERRQYAAMKFFLYTLLGSVLMLLAVIGLHFSYLDPEATGVQLGLWQRGASITGGNIAQVQQLLAQGRIAAADQVHGFNIVYLSQPANLVPGSLLASVDLRTIAFGLLFAAFAIKLPMVPLHTWLPDAHVEASTPISVVLAGVLLKVGGYGILRICYGIFPDVALQLAYWVALLAVVSIVYGALLALAQTDLKRLVAYSSVSHMGYVLLGIAAAEPAGWNGAVLQMFNHGVISAMLFLLVGVLYDRVHDREIGHFRGLWQRMPQYTTFMLVGVFAGLGLPLTSAFVSEFLVFLGAFNSVARVQLFGWVLPAVGLLGIFLSAVYFLWAFQRMFFGSYATFGGRDWDAALTDLRPREYLSLLPCVFFILLLGVWPAVALNELQDWVAQAVPQVYDKARELTVLAGGGR